MLPKRRAVTATRLRQKTIRPRLDWHALRWHWPFFLPIFAGVGTAGATQFLRGRAPTIGRAKRMFRRPVIIPVLVSKQNNAPEMAGAVDISRGGVKLLWKRKALLEERPVCRRSSRHWFWRD